MKLTDLHADSDGIEAAGCDSVNIVAPVVNSTEAHVSDIAVENVRLDAARSSQGAMRFLGLEFFTPPSPTTQPTKTAAMPTPAATATTNPAGFQLTVDRLDFKNLSTVFEDAAATPPAKLAMIVDDVSIAPIVIDSRHADQATNFKITMHAPGIAQAISIDGSAQLASQSKSAHVNVAATGLGLTAIETYLKPLGIESTLADARFKATLEANWSMLPNQIKAALSLHDVELADANGSLLALSAATIDGLSLDTNTGGISFDQVQLTGPALIARREATGVLDLLGLRLHQQMPPLRLYPPHRQLPRHYRRSPFIRLNGPTFNFNSSIKPFPPKHDSISAMHVSKRTIFPSICPPPSPVRRLKSPPPLMPPD